VPAKADPFVQRRLLDVARIDQAVAAAEHRRRTLPELAQIADGAATVERLRGAVVRGQAEIGDLDRESRKLDNEIEQVRGRARRQSTLEDEALELMERREVADAQQSTIESDLATARAELAAAERRRDDAIADIDDELRRAAAERAGLVEPMPADLLSLYEQIRSRGRTAAAALNGSRCEACRMDLDRSALNDIWAAGPDDVVRCTECGAILIRTS
jgi:predicted  nucleic acid-binding Zn-ribbon protein